MAGGLREQPCCGAIRNIIKVVESVQKSFVLARKGCGFAAHNTIKLPEVTKMQIDYEKYARIFKAMSDPKRLKIIDMLSEGELCACKILEEFQITQPTLSHDMKLLCDLGIVKARKEGKWMQYSLDMEVLNDVYKTVGRLMIPGDYAGLLNCNCNIEKKAE